MPSFDDYIDSLKDSADASLENQEWLESLPAVIAENESEITRLKSERDRLLRVVQLFVEEIDDVGRHEPFFRLDPYSGRWEKCGDGHAVHISMALGLMAREELANHKETPNA